jgi:tRNA A-37 threonylcarbamoyl transferase component Bud32
VAGGAQDVLFGKLYAKAHLRADRWYKLGRTILYGTLEDEKPYSSVRRLVQYEDYVLRVMRDVGLPSARSYGFVEITPEREYLLVTEFLEGGVEISEAEVDDDVIDDALATVRLMWDAGLAHRDIKPANILVRSGKVLLIDPAFGEIRPSPWRQAVDLANMMVVLAFRTDADRVYSRALRFFSPEEIAEAFAATRSVTMPSQSRNLLRRHSREGRDILTRFRELAPRRRPIAIQRWSLQRIALTLGALIGSLVALVVLLDNLESGAL